MRPHHPTLSFDAWLEDSEAIDIDGEPLVVYHATHGDFDDFQVGNETINHTTFGPVTTSRSAIFTSPDVKFCEAYLKKSKAYEGANIRPLVLSVRQPLDLREGLNGVDLNDLLVHANGTFIARDFYYMEAHEMWQLFDDEFGENVVQAARAAGFDGAVMIERHPETGEFAEVWAVFDPSQIRSAIDYQAHLQKQQEEKTTRNMRPKLSTGG